MFIVRMALILIVRMVHRTKAYCRHPPSYVQYGNIVVDVPVVVDERSVFCLFS